MAATKNYLSFKSKRAKIGWTCEHYYFVGCLEAYWKSFTELQ